MIIPPINIKTNVLLQLELQKINIIKTDDIESLINEISACKIFISTDSNPLQIAVLFGKPKLTIYYPTNPQFHIPFVNYHKYIWKTLGGSPINEKYCFSDAGDSCPNHDCSNLLTVGEALTKTESLLKKSTTIKNA